MTTDLRPRRPADAPRRPRRRAWTALAAVLALVAGIVVTRAAPTSDVGDAAGSVLYTVMVYLGLVLLMPRMRPWLAAVAAGGWSCLMELLQAVGVAAAVTDRVPVAAWVLGSGFEWRDLAWYVVAAAGAWAVDSAWSRRRAVQSATSTP